MVEISTSPIPLGRWKKICGYNQGLGERLFVCETLDDMCELYDGYARGGALEIQWYLGNDVGFVIGLPPVENPPT